MPQWACLVELMVEQAVQRTVPRHGSPYSIVRPHEAHGSLILQAKRRSSALDVELPASPPSARVPTASATAATAAAPVASQEAPDGEVREAGL
eukprot:12512695-Alexandrium_andersonii.AAC.1